MTDWHAEVDVTVPDGFGDHDIAAALHAMPSYATVTHDGGKNRVTITYGVEASTLRQATEQAIRTVRDATGSAPTGLRVIPQDQLAEELARPAALDLVGMVEAGEILGVSRQRVYQLAEQHPDFPPPVVELAAGKVFTRASIEAFEKQWQRKRTGRPPKAQGDARAQTR